MIVRVFQVLPQAGKAAEFDGFFRDTAVPLMKRQPGLVALHASGPAPGRTGPTAW